MMGRAKEAADVDLIKKLIEVHKTGMVEPPNRYEPEMPPQPKITYEQDEFSQRKVAKINVQVMVENLLGGQDPNRDVQVVIEKYGKTMHTDYTQDKFAFVVVNLCNLKTGEIITLREPYGKFPSSEFLTKLELLRVGEKIK